MKYISEFIGSFLLVATVVGSGIMAENLANGNDAIALLGNTIATGAILFVIIKMFAEISGAHFNPAVSLIFFLRKELNLKELSNYVCYQMIGGILAIISIHYIFQINILQISTNIRGETPLMVSEIIATSGLILTILFVRKNDSNSVAIAVALFITAGYWFTSSTSFANPMVTFSRMFTDTFTGISPISAPYFLIGQLIGVFMSYMLFRLYESKS